MLSRCIEWNWTIDHTDEAGRKKKSISSSKMDRARPTDDDQRVDAKLEANAENKAEAAVTDDEGADTDAEESDVAA